MADFEKSKSDDDLDIAKLIARRLGQCVDIRGRAGTTTDENGRTIGVPDILRGIVNDPRIRRQVAKVYRNGEAAAAR